MTNRVERKEKDKCILEDILETSVIGSRDDCGHSDQIHQDKRYQVTK